MSSLSEKTARARAVLNFYAELGENDGNLRDLLIDLIECMVLEGQGPVAYELGHAVWAAAVEMAGEYALSEAEDAYLAEVSHALLSVAYTSGEGEDID